jgi:hypothetical protein
MNQIAFTILLGPLFLLGLVLARALKLYTVSEKRFKHVRELQSEFHGTSALFSLPVAVAAIVRAHQGATLFEISFLQSLLALQFLGSISNIIIMSNIIATWITIGYIPSDKTVGECWERAATMRIVFRVLCFFSELDLYSTFMARFHKSPDAYNRETNSFSHVQITVA